MYIWVKINGEWELCEIGTADYFESVVDSIYVKEKGKVIGDHDLGTIFGYKVESPRGELVDCYFIVLRSPEKTMIFVRGQIQTSGGIIGSGDVFVRFVRDTTAGKRWFARNRGSVKLDSDISPNQIFIVPPTSWIHKGILL